jgi:toxin ParE1/3/4
VFFGPEAQEDLDQAIEWYEKQRAGLGTQLLAAVREVIERLQWRPESYPITLRGTRRALTRRFPYHVIYRVEAERIVIVAVFHSSRDPQGWHGRV